MRRQGNAGKPLLHEHLAARAKYLAGKVYSRLPNVFEDTPGDGRGLSLSLASVYE